MTKHDVKKPTHSRPPVVAVLGHVDHGKTTLLDYIRKTDVAAREHGGITQHIGAYQLKFKVKNPKLKVEEEKVITFIDTPGHEAFAKMRSRGAAVADLAILVVDAADSVMPQTIESIKQIKAAKIPLIVAANKMDLSTANLGKLKTDLAKHEVQVEGFGGEVPLVPISAKTGKGVKELLDLLLLVAEMAELPDQPKAPLSAVVVETRLDKGKGIVATAIIKQGTLRPGISIYLDSQAIAKVRALFDEHGQPVSEALPSKPVEILGFRVEPPVGAILTDLPQLAKPLPSAAGSPVSKVVDLPAFLNPIDQHEKQKLTIVLKADTAGSLEAILNSLDPRIVIVSSAIGEIGEGDILLAKNSGAIIIGFNVKIPPAVEKLAQTEKVIVRTYNIIYELLNELSSVVAGLKEVLVQERELGVGQIIAEFPFDNQRIAGTKIISGRLARGDSVKIMRSDKETGRSKIKSLRRGKEDVSKAEKGLECGVLLDKKVDFAVGDAIIAVTI